MNTLNFATGLVTFTVNDTAEVTFNPTDSNFVERLFRTFEELDKKQEAYKQEASALTDAKEIFECTQRRDKEMRSLIDAIFEGSVSDAIFGTLNAYALADGLPIWCNFLLAVMDKVDTTFAEEHKATNPRISKYLAKYHR